VSDGLELSLGRCVLHISPKKKCESVQYGDHGDHGRAQTCPIHLKTYLKKVFMLLSEVTENQPIKMKIQMTDNVLYNLPI
jgi:hypothetical protein